VNLVLDDAVEELRGKLRVEHTLTDLGVRRPLSLLTLMSKLCDGGSCLNWNRSVRLVPSERQGEEARNIGCARAFRDDHITGRGDA
jgi:hypothetical protein